MPVRKTRWAETFTFVFDTDALFEKYKSTAMNGRPPYETEEDFKSYFDAGFSPGGYVLTRNHPILEKMAPYLTATLTVEKDISKTPIIHYLPGGKWYYA